MGDTLTLPRTTRCTSTGAIDEAVGVGDILQLHLTPQIVLVIVHLLVEVVAEEHVVDVVALKTSAGGLHAIDVEVQVTPIVHTNGEALLAAVRLRLGMSGCYTEVHGRSQAEGSLHTYQLEINRCDIIIFIPCGGYILRAAFILQYLCEELGNGRSYSSHDAGSTVFQEIVEILTGHRRDGTDIRAHLRVVARKGLTIAERAAAISAEVLHQVTCFQFLFLVLGYHLHPLCDDFLIVIHLVDKLFLTS